MKRDAGMPAVCTLCSLLLIAVSCAAAAAVTHGDLMLSGGTPFRLQFHGPKGKLKATIKVKGCKSVWGTSVSQDGRYAAVGCSFQPPGTKAPPGRPSFFDYINDPIKIVLLQLTGRSPKVLGARILPGYNNGTTTGCSFAAADWTPYESKPLALRSSILPGGAGAVLEVFLSIRCLPVTRACSDEGWWFGASAVQLWTVTHNKFKTIGRLVTGERATFRDKVRCGAEGLSVAVNADGKVYAAFGFNVAKPDFFDTVGIYEVRRNLKSGMQLIPTWKFKADGFSWISKFLPSGPVTGCGIAEPYSPEFNEGNRVCSFAKGRAPYIGKIKANGLDFGYADISCKGDVVYATMLTSKAARVLKVSTGLLRKGATGNMVVNASSDLAGIAVIP